MASGSKKWQLYTADSGVQYAVNIDEGNGEALGFADFAAGTTGVQTLPRGIRMRYVNARNAEGRTRRFWVGTPTQTNFLNGGTFTIDEVEWTVTAPRGEVRTLPYAIDTGEDDGDAT
jgi:hypothetical protein